MKVIVCGGRTYSDRSAVFGALDALRQRVPYGTLIIIQGGSTGADALAREWATARIQSCANAPADWRRYGRAAGPLRNQEMIDNYNPQLVMAFPGGSGTADMVRRARDAGIEVIQPAQNDNEFK
jgi:aspartokinase-like uncharacterized kinase